MAKLRNRGENHTAYTVTIGTNTVRPSQRYGPRGRWKITAGILQTRMYNFFILSEHFFGVLKGFSVCTKKCEALPTSSAHSTTESNIQSLTSGRGNLNKRNGHFKKS